jgi:hypothetical protein
MAFVKTVVYNAEEDHESYLFEVEVFDNSYPETLRTNIRLSKDDIAEDMIEKSIVDIRISIVNLLKKVIRARYNYWLREKEVVSNIRRQYTAPELIAIFGSNEITSLN